MTGHSDTFGRVADLVTILGVVVSAVVLVVHGSAQQVIMAVTLSFLTVVTCGMAWRQSVQLNEAAARVLQVETLNADLASHAQKVNRALTLFSNAVEDFKRAYYELSRPDVESPGSAAQGFSNKSEAACMAVASALRTLTGHECRVVLQELYTLDQSSGPTGAVRTINTSDRTALPGLGTVDLVERNTDFAALVAGGEYFHSNDLRVNLQAGYMNSHWTPDKLREWSQTGDYPYLSTVVWPIRVRRDGTSTTSTWLLAGFLSVDSRDAGVFDLTVVKPLGAAVASVAYTGLSLYGVIQDSQEHTQYGKG